MPAYNHCELLEDQKGTLKLLRKSGFPAGCCDRLKLFDYLNKADPKLWLRSIDKTGWINDCEYICPSFQITSPDCQEVYELPKSAQDWGYGQQGTLAEWQENICKYCANNHILTFSLCVGLSGPLLRFFQNVGTTIIHLSGQTSRGKTTVLRLSASLWGNPNERVRLWRNTDNALKSVFESYNDSRC
jgi:putative DNA primase/helicase